MAHSLVFVYRAVPSMYIRGHHICLQYVVFRLSEFTRICIPRGISAVVVHAYHVWNLGCLLIN